MVEVFTVVHSGYVMFIKWIKITGVIYLSWNL